jgi:hypothetical protein
MWMVVIEQGNTAEAVLDATDGVIDSMTRTARILIASLREKWLKNSDTLSITS